MAPTFEVLLLAMAALVVFGAAAAIALTLGGRGGRLARNMSLLFRPHRHWSNRPE
jgi:hypothetical protein